MKKSIIVNGVLILFVTFSLAFAEEMAAEKAEETKPTPEETFKQACSQCHPIDRPLAKTKSAKGWELTVKRMQKKDPSRISDDDAKVIIEFLQKKDGN